jgi:hypothetical protein
LPTHFGDLCTFNGRAISSTTKASRQIFQSKFYLSSFGPNVGFPAIQASSSDLIFSAGFQKGNNFCLAFFVVLSFSSEHLFKVFTRSFSTSFAFQAQFFVFPSLFLPRFCPQAPFRSASRCKTSQRSNKQPYH